MLTSSERHSAPSASISGCATSSSSGALLAITTLAPRRAKPLAIDLPMPRPPPVTTAVLPSKRPGAKDALGSKSLIVSLLGVVVSGGPGGPLAGARVVDDAALEVEGHDGAAVGRVGGPARIAGGREAQPARVHLVGERLRRGVAGDRGAAGGAERVEHERHLEVVAGLQAAGVL